MHVVSCTQKLLLCMLRARWSPCTQFVESCNIWFLRYWVLQTEFVLILGHFCPFTSPLTNKKNFLKKWKKAWRYHFMQMYHKWQSYNIWFLRYWAWQTEFVLILDHFALLPPPLTAKKKERKFRKNENTWRYYHFIHVYHKWQSYDI